METNSKKVMEAMPSFDEFMNLAESIKIASVEKMKLENQIKSAEALAFKAVMTDEKYFVGGKPVAVSYFENYYKTRGIDGEILELRFKLAEIVAYLESLRNQFEIYKSMHDLFKTLVYQERVLT